MTEEIRCALDGADLTSLDPRIHIQDVEERPRMRVETRARPGYGSALAASERESLAVIISLMIKEPDGTARQQAMQAVRGWAKRGWLTVSTRPGQRLYVVCTQPPETRWRRWSEETQIVLTAYDGAFWQDVYPAAAGFTGADGSAGIRPGGTRACRLEAEIRNASGERVDSVALSANGETMAFAGLGLAAGETLRISYDERGLLHAEAAGEGKLSCRTAESADDVPLFPARENTVRFAADGECAVTLRARGVYD